MILVLQKSGPNFLKAKFKVRYKGKESCWVVSIVCSEGDGISRRRRWNPRKPSICFGKKDSSSLHSGPSRQTKQTPKNLQKNLLHLHLT